MKDVRAQLTCEDVEHILDLYLDGEVDEVERREIEMHLHHCEECAKLEACHRHTRRRLRALAGESRATDEFKQRLAIAIAEGSEAEPEAESTELSTRNGRARTLGLIGGALAACAIGAVSIGIFGWSSDSPGQEPVDEVLGMTSVRSPIVQEAIAWHERQVPVEVTGPDEERVAEWFEKEGMVDFDMAIPDLGRRATLLGGRLSHVRYHEAGYLLYEVGGDKVTVLIFSGDALTDESGETADSGLLVDNHSGHTVVLKTEGDLSYSFTSDMASEELVRLVENAL